MISLQPTGRAGGTDLTSQSWENVRRAIEVMTELDDFALRMLVASGEFAEKDWGTRCYIADYIYNRLESPTTPAASNTNQQTTLRFLRKLEGWYEDES